jgi:GT2 family glycosyltransferase
MVTYNRRPTALAAAGAVLAQELAAAQFIVIDNASTDGTADALRAAFGDRVEVVEMARNTGGAGGFAAAIEIALARGAATVWCMDDDAIAQPTALGALVAAYERYPGTQRPALVASHVVWVDGSTHRMNIPRRRRDASAEDHRRAAAVGCTPIRTSSFVSVLVDASAARSEAPVVADYFLWNDDVEYTARLLRHRVGLRCPSSVVTHQTPTNYSTLAESGDRLYLDVRNMMWFVGRGHGLAPRERAFFVAVMLRRWWRTGQRSRHRPATARTIARAIGSSLRRGPRPNTEVMQAAYRVPPSRSRL